MNSSASQVENPNHDIYWLTVRVEVFYERMTVQRVYSFM